MKKEHFVRLLFDNNFVDDTELTVKLVGNVVVEKKQNLFVVASSSLLVVQSLLTLKNKLQKKN